MILNGLNAKELWNIDIESEVYFVQTYSGVRWDWRQTCRSHHSDRLEFKIQIHNIEFKIVKFCCASAVNLRT
jgi:hypothetical protein